MVTIDSLDGGRWTSLHLAGREWLWAGPGLVAGPRTGHTVFTDAGGLDECFPTVRGTPDHGGLWNQPWSESVTYQDTQLIRTFTTTTDTVVADYHLTAPPGYAFTWAAHALLDCEVGATISVADGTQCRLYPEAAPLLDDWPAGAPWVSSPWPTSIDLGTYAPTDGTAVGAVLVDCPTATVRDRGAELTLTLSCPGQPISTALWRNLGGFPTAAPYRSLGVEPMLGRVFDLAEAGPGDAAVVPPSGELAWRLTLTARPV
ncbi:hypothetical protein HPO96_24540 [Kribbella sandramycini]|uniref:Galactose mutarotase-like enzyme n=1 Tax=Kribbella sandramycini TaxID=60450 RepID=A0A7Y4P184_9ACTN|nr:hypothetical protein [Kribbella sandramycini]MBB6571176.1 hypothetical protein [Kribbella sandramycini]NOL43416.1 hypothetical protein [Kribbella sandramycini]